MLIATCDDDIQYCEQVECFVTRLGESLGIEVKCDKYQSGADLLDEDFCKYGIIFLDIDMINENGINVAEKIREKDQRVEIIFLTALIQYAVEGYKVKAYRFLVKPVEYDDFKFQLSDLMLRIDNFEKSNLVLTKDGQDYTVKIEEIMYIEVIDHYLTYHCVNYDLTVVGTMKKAENNLKGHYFVRIHNSYTVNMRYISKVKSQYLILENGIELPLSRGKKEKYRKVYLDFWGDELG